MRVLFLKSFSGHKGRKGKRGGSLPRYVPDRVPFTVLRGDELAGETEGDVRASATAHVKEHFRGGIRVHNAALDDEVRLSISGGKHPINHKGNVDQIRAVVGVPEMLRHAVYSHSGKDADERQEILAWHYLGAPLRIADREYVARLALQENHEGHLFYDHGLITRRASPELSNRFAHQDAGPGDPAAGDAMDVAEVLEHVKDYENLRKALGAGERWVTIHPHGPDTKGQPLLIKEQPDGSAKVIGGAGGSMNHLRLTGVKSAGDYATEARSKAADRRDKKKLQRAEDKKNGLTENKKEAKEAVRAALQAHQQKFIDTVAAAAGWSEDETRFPVEKYQDATVAEQNRASRQHARELMARARDVVKTQRANLVRDAEARAEAGLGEVPLTGASPESLTVQDIDPVAPATKGLGYSTNYRKRAEKAGLTEGELATEATAAKPEGAKPVGERMRDELKAIRDPAPLIDKTTILEAKKAVDLLKAEKILKAAAADARAQKQKIEGAKERVEPKAFVIETSQADEADVAKEIEDDLRTARTRGFLDKVGEAGGSEALGRHIGVGGYNSINALALAAGGSALVDRSTVDVLGIAGAAQVLARRLSTDLSAEEFAQVQDAVGQFHVKHYMETSDAALREARSWQEMASEIELGEDATTGADFARAQELNAKRRDFTEAAQKVLGTAYGEMEANAALVAALGRPKTDKLQVSLGSASIEDAIRQARAIGLERGQYQVERAGASTILTVTGDGMDKLAAPVSREDLARTRASLDIIEGRKDEDGWLPLGVANRPELAMNVQPGTADRYARPYPKAPGDQDKAIRTYIGARAADGDSPADIMRDLLSEDTQQRAGDRRAYMDALDQVAPLYDADGKMVRDESRQAAFEELADHYVAGMGGERTAIHRQQFAVDDTAVEALHQALAKTPEGPAAFKAIGDLSPQDQAALRGVFAKEYGRTDPEGEKHRAELAKLDASEPEREIDDMFGRSTNPEWSDWQASRNEAAERVNKSTMTWSKYLETMGSPQAAYSAMQDVVRGRVLADFATHHNTLKPDAPLKIGKGAIAHDLAHLDALDPAARDRRKQERDELTDRLRNRVAGRYAGGSVSDKLDAAREAEAAAEQSQMGLFGSAPAAAAEDESKPLPAPSGPELGERVTIGHAAERQVAGMMPIVGKQFRAGQPPEMFRPDMSGRYVGRQRAVKLIEQNKRTVLGLGVGSGKTAIMLSGFTHLQQQGKAKRGLFAVPSIVQGEFHGSALALLEPGKFNWHADPKATRDERIAAYKNPDVHFNVVTHQALRDDLMHLASQREGVTPDEVATRLEAMQPAERSKYMRDLLDAEGIDHDYMAVDEGQNLLNRAGKENSRMANVLDGVSDSLPYYVSASGDPVKNDVSEAYDVLSKMDRARYSDRDAFMRKYGVDTAAARDGLNREMARHFYTGRIDPGVKKDIREESVPLDDRQHAALKEVDGAVIRARLARMKGETDLEALRTLSPGSFAHADPSQHEAIAAQLNKSLGILHSTAQKNIVNGGAKTDHLAKLAGARRGRQGVVFAHSLSRVKEIAERLKKEGHRVETLTGGDSTADKDRKKRAFKGGQHDIMVMSDAGAVGANMQSASWLAQYDTPDTAMLHAQRRGRIDRNGQKNDIELMDLVADHPAEKRARERLANKYDLRDITTSPLEGLDDHGIAGFLRQVQAGQAEASAPIAKTHPGGAWRPQRPGEQLAPDAHTKNGPAGQTMVADEMPAPGAAANDHAANDDEPITDDRQAGLF